MKTINNTQKAPSRDCYCCFASYGGGGGGFDGAGGGYGGGGGYGCCCCCCLWEFCCCGWFGCCGGQGGFKYGDKELTVLHLGSGGGGEYPDGYGGGALKVLCFGTIIFKTNSKISCDGGDGFLWSGGGSGGSIHIVVNNNNNIKWSASSSISSIGGKGGVGNGGVGRIRIQFISDHKDFNINKYDIHPQPFIG